MNGRWMNQFLAGKDKEIDRWKTYLEIDGGEILIFPRLIKGQGLTGQDLTGFPFHIFPNSKS